MQPDIKKLITAFLGISLITSAISFSFLGSVGLGESDLRTGEAAGSPKNAFADISLITPPWRTTVTPSSSVKDPFASSNLTENFSEVISHELLLAATITGEPNRVALNQALQKIESRVLQEEEVPLSKIKINNQAQIEDTVAYIKEVRDTLESVTQNPLYKEIGTTNPTVEKIRAVENLFKNEQERLSMLSVPKIMVPLHKSLLSFMGGRQKFFKGLAEYENDPIKTIFTLQNKERILKNYTTALTQELEKVEPAMKLSYLGEDPSWWIIDQLFSLFIPQKAHATLPTIDVAAIAESIRAAIQDALAYAADAIHYVTTELDAAMKWAQTKLEWAEQLATEQLKNVLVQLFVVQSIAWINGDGVPKFVTNWRTYADEAAVLGINKGFSQISSEACGTFGPTMLESLNSSFNTYNMPSNCARNSTGRMLESFRNNSFNEGGWSAYGTAISPRGNYFQNYTDYSMRINESADKEIKAAINEVIANDGFPSQKNCPESEAVPEQNSTPANDPNQSQAPPTPLPDGSCADGTEPRATTPGVMFKAALDEATVAPIKRITSAENLINLAFNLANGALTKTRAQGSRGLTGLNNAASLNVNAAQTYDLRDACTGFTPGTPGHTNCLESVGAAGNVQTNLDDTTNQSSVDTANAQAIATLKTEAQNISRNRNSIATVNNQTLAFIQEIAFEDGATLNRVRNNCDITRSSEAQATKGDLQIMRTKIKEVDIPDRDLMATDILILSQSTDLARVRDQLDQFKTTYGTLASTTSILSLSQDRSAEVRTIKTQAEDNLPNSCATPIQRVTPSLLSNP